MIGHHNHLLLIRIHDIDALVWQEKLFFLHIFCRIKVYPSNETNLDSYNNLHYFFVIRHYNHVFLIGLHDIGALDLQEKLFLPPFSL